MSQPDDGIRGPITLTTKETPMFILRTRSEDGTIYYAGPDDWACDRQFAVRYATRKEAEAIAKDLNYKREEWIGVWNVVES